MFVQWNCKSKLYLKLAHVNNVRIYIEIGRWKFNEGEEGADNFVNYVYARLVSCP